MLKRLWAWHVEHLHTPWYFVVSGIAAVALQVLVGFVIVA